MSIFTKVLAWCGGILITSTAVVTPCYYCIPEFKDAVNKNVLKIEQTATDTSEKDKKINELTLKLEEKTLAHEVLSADLLEEKEKVAKLELSAQQDAETITTLQISLTEKSNALNTALEEKDALMLEIETLENEKNNLSSQIEGLNSTIENNESEIAQLEGENASLKEQKQGLEDDLLANATQISELNSRIETNNARIEELENENSSKQSQIDNLTESIETLEDEKALLEGQVEEKDSEITDLQNQVTTLTTERDNALTSLAETQSELQIVQEEVNSLENDLALKEVEIASLNEQISIYENAIERDESKLYIEDFLNDGNINVFKEDEHNYLLSSSSSLRKGLYRFNIIDYSIVQVIDSGYDYKSFYRASDGTIYCGKFDGGSFGYLTVLKTDGTILTNKGGFGNIVVENSNGDIISYYFNQTRDYVYVYDIEEEVTKNFKSDYYIQSISLLSDGSFIVFAKDSCYYISSSGSSYRVARGYWSFGAELRNGEVVLAYVNCYKICIVSFASSYCSLNEYSVSSDAKKVMLDYCFELRDGDLLLNGSVAGGGIYKFNKSVGIFTLLKENIYGYDIFVEDENGVTLSSSQFPHWSSLYYSYETGEIAYL